MPLHYSIYTPILGSEVEAKNMAITVRWGKEGAFAVCDTPAEAMELLRHGNLGNGNGLVGLAQEPTTTGHGGRNEIHSVLSSLAPNAKTLLKALAVYPNGIEAGEFSKASGIQEAAFGGILGSISKIAKKHGLMLERFVRSEVKMDGDHRLRILTPLKPLIDNKELLG